MATTGVANVAVAIEKVVSALTTKTLLQNSIALQIPGIWDRSGEVRPGMDRLDMIELAELAEQVVDETGAALVPSTINPTAAQLDLDQHKAIVFAVSNRADLQSKIALVSKTVENAARTLAYGVDDYIFGLAVTAAGTSVTVAGADALDEVLEMKEAFDLANVPRENRSMAASAVWIRRLLGTNNVIKANEFGGSEGIRKGLVTEVYGIKIYESTSSNVPADGFLGFGMEAMAFARQMAVSFKSQEQVLSHKTDYSMSHLFGAESTVASNPRIYHFDPV